MTSHLPDDRADAFLEEFGFLGICDLLIRFARKTDMGLDWKHPAGYRISIKPVRTKSPASKRPRPAK